MIFLFSSMVASMMLADSPLVMGLWLLLIALTMSISLNTFIISWFSYLMMLIYVGGMMVMFAYFSAMQPNQPMMLSHLFGCNLILFLFFSSTSNFPMNISLFNNAPKPTLIMSMMNMHQIPIYMTLIIVLLLTLISVVKIATKSMGPLRPFQYYV